jgi:hypothetical protein
LPEARQQILERPNAEASRAVTSADLDALDEVAGRLVNGEYRAVLDGEDVLCMALKPVARA